MKKLKLNKIKITRLAPRGMRQIKGGSLIMGTCDVTNVPDQCATDANRLCPWPEKE